MTSGFQFLVFGVLAQVLLLPANDWVNFRPPLPQLSGLAVSPEDPLIVYVVAGDFVRGDDGVIRNSSALFRSDDGAASWTEVAKVPAGESGPGILIDPLDPSRILAVTLTATFGSRAYATRDRGANWVLVIDLPVCSQLSISFDGVFPGRAYASACGELLTTEDGFQWSSRASTLPADTRALRSVHGDLYARTESEVFRSRDRGDSWVPIVRAPAICPTITAFAVDPEDSEVLYVATGKAAPMRFVCGGLYKSPDGGRNVYRTALPDQYITSIIVDPADSGRVYTTSVQTGFFSPLAAIFRSLDRGLSWENFNGRTFGQAGIAISATGKVLYAVSNGGVFRREIAKRRSLPPR